MREVPSQPLSDGGPASVQPSREAGALPSAQVRTVVPLPLRLRAGVAVRASVATFNGLVDGREHLAVIFGDALDAPSPLVRLHSECLTGDVLGSARCDCGPQLRECLDVMARSGGVLLYLRQEGRGIGLYNKIDCYALQDDGLDTYQANRALSFGDDLRIYRSAAQMLHALGVTAVELLTNNPDKARQLQESGIQVQTSRSTGVHVTEANRRYLQSKLRHGHRLTLTEGPLR